MTEKKKGATALPMPTRTYTEPHPVKLDDREVAQRARAMVELEGKLAEHELKGKRFMDNHKAEARIMDEERRSYADAVRTGQEDRDVECAEYHLFDVDGGIARTIRTDTGEEVEPDRPLDVNERQAPLPLNGHQATT